MGLREAVSKLVDRMRKESEGIVNNLACKQLLNQYSDQLELVLEASAEEEQPVDIGGVGKIHVSDRMIRKIESQVVDDVRRGKEEVHALEVLNPEFTALIGGGSDGVMTIAPGPEVPVGAKTIIDSQIYVLGSDRKLRFSAEETAKLGK